MSWQILCLSIAVIFAAISGLVHTLWLNAISRRVLELEGSAAQLERRLREASPMWSAEDVMRAALERSMYSQEKP